MVLPNTELCGPGNLPSGCHLTHTPREATESVPHEVGSSLDPLLGLIVSLESATAQLQWSLITWVLMPTFLQRSGFHILSQNPLSEQS